MPDLQHFKARICHTVAGFLVKDNKVLLVKHKKLGIWLAPGGHVEDGELPHRAAQREFKEETGLTAYAVSFKAIIDGGKTEYLPNPFATNLHWISKENYDYRLATGKIMDSEKWPRGCEQHLCWIYLMDLTNPTSDTLKHDPNESDAIGWFTLDELDKLETTKNIKDEAKMAIALHTV